MEDPEWVAVVRLVKLKPSEGLTNIDIQGE